MAIVTTTVINSILTVRNPAGNSTALTITPLAGGTRPVSAHLVVIWQYSHTGKINGIHTNVDLNYGYIDYPKSMKTAGLNGFCNK